MKKLVSIVIPSYGGGQYLSRAVDSVLNQTYSDIEVIVVDDNGLGTSNQVKTEKVMSAYKSNHKVKYVCHEVNKNGSAARNTGERYANGEYIALLDDDDEYFPEKIEKQVADIEKLDNSYALVYCGVRIFTNDKQRGEVRKTESGYLFYEVMLHKVVVGSSSLLIRRSAWEKLGGFDESFRRHQDWEFSARVAYHYNIFANDFIGVKRNIMLRNSPKDPDITLKYRKHYLLKMEPYIQSLPKAQQKDVVVSNLVDVCFQYLKRKRYIDAVKLYISIRPGMRGLKIIYGRAKIIINRGKLRVSD